MAWDTYRSQGCKARSQQDKLNRIKQVRFSTTIATDNAVRSRREWMNLGLLPEGSKVRYRNLFDVHGVQQFELSRKRDRINNDVE